MKIAIPLGAFAYVRPRPAPYHVIPSERDGGKEREAKDPYGAEAADASKGFLTKICAEHSKVMDIIDGDLS